MREHVFVDETMRGGYYVAAAIVLPGDLADARRAINGLRMPGQRRLHFYTESDSRRRLILSAILALRPEVLIYDASSYRRNRDARQACLEALVDNLAARGADRLTLERDDSLIEHDRRILYTRARKAGCAESLIYAHLRAHEEPLLAIPDAIAWCWTRGGRWRASVRPIVARVEHV